MDVYPTPLIGYKELIYYGKLYSPMRKVIWDTAEQIAGCSLNHEAPHETHGCGLWALWEPSRYVLRHTHHSGRGRMILALVWGYGDWYANELSWRAEKMRIAALCSGGSCKSVEPLASVLAVPALTLEEMREYAEYAGMRLEGEDG